MMLKEMMAQLETAAHPLARAVHQTAAGKVLVLAFKKGMALKAHKTAVDAKLMVLAGSVVYCEGDGRLPLAQYEETPIPPGVLHTVECNGEDGALCLLIQG